MFCRILPAAFCGLVCFSLTSFAGPPSSSTIRHDDGGRTSAQTPAVTKLPSGFIALPAAGPGVTPTLIAHYVEENSKALFERLVAMEHVCLEAGRGTVSKDSMDKFVALLKPLYDDRLKGRDGEALDKVATTMCHESSSLGRALLGDFEKDVEAALTTYRVDPKTISFDALINADRQNPRIAKYQLKRILAAIAQPAGELKKSLDRLVAGRSEVWDGAKVGEWAMNRARDLFESDPAMAETYARLAWYARGGLNTVDTKTFMAYVGRQKTQADGVPFTFKPLPDGEAIPALGQALVENHRVLIDELARLNNPAAKLEDLKRRFGPYVALRDSHDLSKATDIADVRARVQSALTGQYAALLAEAKGRAGAKADELPIVTQGTRFTHGTGAFRDELLENFESYFALVEKRLTATNDAAARRILAAGLKEEIEHVTKLGLGADQIPFKAMALADEIDGGVKYFLAKIEAEINLPAGQKAALARIIAARAGHGLPPAPMPESDVLAEWAWTQAGEARGEARPEAYARLAQWLVSGTANGEKAALLTEVANRKTLYGQLPSLFKWNESVVNGVQPGRAKSVHEILTALHGALPFQLGRLSAAGADKDTLLKEFGALVRFHEGGDPTKLAVADLQKKIRDALVKAFANQIAYAKNALGDDAIPVDVAASLDRFCHGQALPACAGERFRFVKRVKTLLGGHSTPPVSLDRLLANDPPTRRDLDGIAHEDLQKLEDWATKTAKEVITSKPELAQALAVLAARIRDAKPNFQNQSVEPPVHTDAYLGGKALAAITQRPPHFKRVAPLSAVAPTAPPPVQQTAREANFAKVAAVVKENRENFEKALKELKNIDRAGIRAKYGALIPSFYMNGDFDLSRAKDVAIDALSKEWLASAEDAKAASMGPDVQRLLGLETLALADHLDGQRKFKRTAPAAQLLLYAAGISRPPSAEWKTAYDTAPNPSDKVKTFATLSDAEKIHFYLGQLENGDLIGSSADDLKHLLQRAMFHPSAGEALVASALGVLHTSIGDRSTPRQWADGETPVYFQPEKLAGLVPWRHGPATLGKADGGSCPTPDAARTAFAGRGNKVTLATPAANTLEARLAAAVTNKNLVLEAFIALENEEDMARAALAATTGQRPALETQIAAKKRAAVEQSAAILTAFGEQSEKLFVGQPAHEALSYPSDFLLLVDRADRVKRGMPGQRFLAKAQWTAEKAKQAPLAQAIAQVRGGAPIAQFAKTIASASQAAIEACTKTPADCSPDAIDTFSLLQSLAGQDFAPLTASALEGYGVNGKSLVACAKAKPQPVPPSLDPKLIADALDKLRDKTTENAEAREKTLGDYIDAYFAKAEPALKAALTAAILRHPLGGLGTGRAKTYRELVATLRGVTDPIDLQHRREAMRSWVLSELIGGLGKISPELAAIVALTGESIEDGFLPSATKKVTAEVARGEWTAEAEKRRTNPARVQAVDAAVANFLGRGHHLPTEARRWILNDLKEPETVVTLARTWFPHEPDAFEKIFLEKSGKAPAHAWADMLPGWLGRLVGNVPSGPSDRESALAAAYDTWGKFALLPDSDPKAIGENRRRAQEALERLKKFKFTEAELDAVYGDYYRARTGWGLLDEMQVRGFDRSAIEGVRVDWGKRIISDDDKKGLIALLMDEVAGIAHLVRVPLPPGLIQPGGVTYENEHQRRQALNAARRNHGLVAGRELENRGKLLSVAREYWQEENRPDGMDAFAKLLFSRTARGMRVDDEGERDREEAQATRVGHALFLMRQFRGKTPSDADIEKAAKVSLAKIAEDAVPNATQKALIEKAVALFKASRKFEHAAPKADDASEDDVKKVAEAMRVARMVGDLKEKDKAKNPLVNEEAFATNASWAQAWLAKIEHDVQGLQRSGLTREERNVLEHSLLTRDILERALDNGPSLTRSPSESVVLEKTATPKIQVLYRQDITRDEFVARGLHGADGFFTRVIDAPNDAERTRILNETINLTVHDGYRVKHPQKPERVYEGWEQEKGWIFGKALVPHNFYYVKALQELRAQMMCEIIGLKAGIPHPDYPSELEPDPSGRGKRPKASAMRAHQQAAVRVIANVDMALIQALPTGEAAKHYDGLRQDILSDVQAYERLVLAQLPNITPGKDWTRPPAECVTAVLNNRPWKQAQGRDDSPFEKEYLNHAETNVKDDAFWGDWVKSYLDDEKLPWDDAHGIFWGQHHPQKKKPKHLTAITDRDTNIPDWGDKFEFGFGRHVQLVPATIPANVQRALDALPKDRRDHYMKQWRYKEAGKEVGIEETATELDKRADFLENDTKSTTWWEELNVRVYQGRYDVIPLPHRDAHVERTLKQLDEAGKHRQRASDMRQGWYEAIMSEYWSTHRVGKAGLPTANEAELKRIPEHFRKMLARYMVHVRNEVIAPKLKRALELDRTKPAEADALRKEARAAQLAIYDLIFSPRASGILWTTWKTPALRAQFLDEFAATTGTNAAAKEVVAKLRDWDKLTHADREALRAKIGVAAALIRRKGDPKSDIADADAPLANYLAAAVNILDDRGHAQRSEGEVEYRQIYEQLRKGNARFDAKNALNALVAEREAFTQACPATGTKAPHCAVLARQIERLDKDGLGMGADARIQLLDPKKVPQHLLDAVERAEAVLTNHADAHKRDEAKRALLLLRLNPSEKTIEGVMNLWDPEYMRQLANRPKEATISEELVALLIKAATNGKATAKTLGKTDAKGPDGEPIWRPLPSQSTKACTDLKPKGADPNQADYVTDIAPDDALGAEIVDKITKMAEISAKMAAWHRLNADGKVPKDEEVEALAKERLATEFRRVDAEMRKLAAERLIRERVTAANPMAKSGAEDPKKPLGCALRALLGPINRQEAENANRESYTQFVDDIASRVRANQPIAAESGPRDEPDRFSIEKTTARIKTWPTDVNKPEYREHAKAEVDARVATAFDTMTGYDDIEGKFAALVATKDQHGVVQPARLSAGMDLQARVADHIHACVEHFENHPDPTEKKALPRAEIELADKPVELAKAVQDEMGAVGLLEGAIIREKIRRDQKSDPIRGEIRAEIDYLGGTEEQNPGAIKRLEEEIGKAKKSPRADSKESKEALEGQEKRLAKFKKKLEELKEAQYKERLKLEAFMSQPTDTRKTREEIDIDEKVKRMMIAKIEVEISRVQDADKRAGRAPELPRFPGPEFLNGLENDGEIGKLVQDFVHAKMESHKRDRTKYGVPASWKNEFMHNIDHEQKQMKMRGLLWAAILDSRNKRITQYRQLTLERTRESINSTQGTLQAGYMGYASKCMAWLEDRKIMTFPRATGDASVFNENARQDFAEMLKKYQQQRQGLEAVAKAHMPPIGTTATADVLTTPTLRNALDAVKATFKGTNLHPKVPDAEVEKLVQRAFAKAKADREKESADLAKHMRDLEPLGFRWNGVSLVQGDLQLWKIGTAVTGIKNNKELRAALEAMGKFGRYAGTGIDPWQELVGTIFQKYTGSGFRPHIELGKTAVKIQQREKPQGLDRWIKGFADGYVGDGINKHDFLTDMTNAEDYLEFNDIEKVRGEAQVLAQEYRKAGEEFGRRRRDFLGAANRAVPIDVDRAGNILPWNWKWDMQGKFVEDKWNAISNSFDTMYSKSRKLRDEYGGINIDWEVGGEAIKMPSHQLTRMWEHSLRHEIGPDVFETLPEEWKKAIDAQENYIIETVVTELVFLGIDYFTAGAFAPVHAELETVIWGARLARAMARVNELYKGVKHGIRMAEGFGFGGKVVSDLYGNWRYGTWQGEPEVSTPWEQTYKGMQHSRLIFGALPLVGAGLEGLWSMANLPVALGPYVTGPLGMAGVTAGVEMYSGQPFHIATEGLLHSALLGMPFNEIMGAGFGRMPLIARSPAAQRVLAFVGTLAIFQGASQMQARDRLRTEGQHINAFTGEAAKADEQVMASALDTMASGLAMDVWFASEAGAHVQEATARTMIRRGVPFSEVKKIYFGEKPADAKKADEWMHKTIGAFTVPEIERARKRLFDLKEKHDKTPPDQNTELGRAEAREKRALDELVGALTKMGGYPEGESQADFWRVFKEVTKDGKKQEHIATALGDVLQQRRRELVDKVRNADGKSIWDMLSHPMFKNAEGGFDFQAISLVPPEMVQKALKAAMEAGEAHAANPHPNAPPGEAKDAQMLISLVAQAWQVNGGAEGDFNAFLVFFTNYKMEPGDGFMKLARLMQGASAPDIAKMLRTGRIDLATADAAFSKLRVTNALSMMHIGTLSNAMDAAADAKHPMHLEARIMLHRQAAEADMPPALFVAMLEHYRKGGDGARPGEIADRQKNLMVDVKNIFRGEFGKKFIADKIASDPDALNGLLGELIASGHTGFDLVSPKQLKFDAQHPNAVSYAGVAAMDHAAKDKPMKDFIDAHKIPEGTFEAYFVEYMKNGHGRDMADMQAALKAAGTAFRNDFREWLKKREAEVKDLNPLHETATKSATKLVKSLEALLTDHDVRVAAIGQVRTGTFPTVQAAKAALERLVALDHAAGADSHQALDGALAIVRHLGGPMLRETDGLRGGGSDPSRLLVQEALKIALASKKTDAAAKVVDALIANPHGGRVLSLMEPAEVAALLKKATDVKGYAGTSLSKMFTEAMEWSGIRQDANGRSPEAVVRARETGLVLVEYLMNRGGELNLRHAAEINAHWVGIAGAGWQDAPAGPYKDALREARWPDLIERHGVKKIEPKLLTHPRVNARIAVDGTMKIRVTVNGTEVEAKALAARMVDAAKATVDGGYSLTPRHNGGYDIEFSGITDADVKPSPTAAKDGRKTFANRVLTIIGN